MASASPGDADDEPAAGEGRGEEGGDNAEDGGEAGEGASAGGSDADDLQEVNDVETSPFFGERDDLIIPLKLKRGDALPLSYRSDNGTRESEFFIGDDKENVNPYYDVVRRLSPTELIGRFMRTASPKVTHGDNVLLRLLMVLFFASTAFIILYQYHGVVLRVPTQQRKVILV